MDLDILKETLEKHFTRSSSSDDTIFEHREHPYYYQLFIYENKFHLVKLPSFQFMSFQDFYDEISIKKKKDLAYSMDVFRDL